MRLPMSLFILEKKETRLSNLIRWKEAELKAIMLWEMMVTRQNEDI